MKSEDEKMNMRSKRSISVFLAVLMVLRLIAISSGITANAQEVTLQELPFIDVHAEHWYFPYVQAMHATSVMQGTSANTFSPEDTFSRAQILATLFRIHHGRRANESDLRENQFADVANDAWYAPYITWARAVNVIVNTGEAVFPNENVSRQELALIVHSYVINLTDFDSSSHASAQWNAFTDRDQISDAASYNALRWANNNGIVNGRTTAAIVPAGTILRSESAAMLVRLMHNVLGIEITIQEPASSGRLEIHHLSMGQADCTLILLPNGQTMLIDAGLPLSTNHVTGGAQIVQYIHSLGISTIDYLIVTHPHFDHIAGLPAVMDAFYIRNLFMPNRSHTTLAFSRLLDAIERNGLQWQEAKAGTAIFDFGNLRADFIAPNSYGYVNINNYSAVTRLEYNNRRFLFMGDAEALSESEILSAGHCIAADVLMIGHHGSRTSTTLPFLQAVSPQIALISVGRDNSYGHPHSQILTRLESLETAVYRTDLDGTVIIVYQSGNFTVTRTGRSVI